VECGGDKSEIIYTADLYVVTSVRIFCSTARRPITASPLISMNGYPAMRIHGIILAFK
ncbi:hypothetical protein M9458_016210, partial [Cirrhinus mrigala]